MYQNVRLLHLQMKPIGLSYFSVAYGYGLMTMKYQKNVSLNYSTRYRFWKIRPSTHRMEISLDLVSIIQKWSVLTSIVLILWNPVTNQICATILTLYVQKSIFWRVSVTTASTAQTDDVGGYKTRSWYDLNNPSTSTTGSTRISTFFFISLDRYPCSLWNINLIKDRLDYQHWKSSKLGLPLVSFRR